MHQPLPNDDSDENVSDDEYLYEIAKEKVSQQKAKKKQQKRLIKGGVMLLLVLILIIILFSAINGGEEDNTNEIEINNNPELKNNPNGVSLTETGTGTKPVGVPGAEVISETEPPTPTTYPTLHPISTPPPSPTSYPTLKPVEAKKETPPPSPTSFPTPKPIVELKPTEQPTLRPTERPTKPEIKLDDRLKILKDEAIKMQKMLEEYYGVKEGFKGKDILEKAFYLRPGVKDDIHETYSLVMAEQFLRAIIYDRPFKVGSIGSSVTAGHDNCHYDCYEDQLERTMAPLFEKAGMEFRVLNGGMTGGCGDTNQNQPFCMRHTLGEDIDLVHYSWTYFEHRKKEIDRERYLRFALRLPHKPPPIIMVTSDGEFRTKAKEETAMLDKYGKYGANFVYMAGGLMQTGYKKNAPGFEGGKVGDGLHKTTRYGEEESDKTRKDSLGVVFRNWHPGPLLFQTTADSFAYQYCSAILKAVELIKEESNPKEKWGPYPDARDLGEPLYCDPNVCKTKEAPLCHNGEIPTYGSPSIRLIEPDDESYPFKEKDYNWERFIGPKTNLIPRQERGMVKCNHLDTCAGWQKPWKVDSGHLVFSFPKVEKGYVGFCAKGNNNAKQGGQEIIDEGKLKVTLDGVEKTLEKVLGKCVLVQKQYEEGKTIPDEHILAIHQAEDGKSFLIDHIFAL